MSKTTMNSALQVMRMEWVWGLDRGGLPYYLSSTHNELYCKYNHRLWQYMLTIRPVRPDIADLYAKHEFALVPTFRTYVELIKFIQHAGVYDRDENDVSPRRPLTALAPPSGRYRYVFVPFSDAARQLQKDFKLQPQTEDDMNGGIEPISGDPVIPGTDDLPVLESYAHPFSVFCASWDTLGYYDYGRSPVILQWLPIMFCIRRQWTSDDIKIPRWFTDAPSRESDDVTVQGSERLGYDLPSAPNSLVRTPLGVEDIRKANISEYSEPRAKVLEWFTKTRPPCMLRRTQRRKERASPYASKLPVSRCRRASPVVRRELRRVAKGVPAWVQRNGCFPTEGFSSTDWAYFYFGASLDSTIGDHHTGAQPSAMLP
ncbi:hypothetical protein HDZ31DRAFT_83417 [Schizophyllum fasciatum]